jgi:hypothetical protein
MKKAGRDAGLFCALRGQIHWLTGPQVRLAMHQGVAALPFAIEIAPTSRF